MRLSFIFIYLSFIVTAKEQNDKQDDGSPKPVLETEISQRAYDFRLNLRGSVRQRFALEVALLDHSRSIICSPLSVLMPLGKLALGARRKTKKEIFRAIGLKRRRQVRKAFEEMIEDMEYLPGVTLDVASKIYVVTKKDINRKFLRRTKEIFRSSCQRITSSDATKVARSINRWVAYKTRDKISHIISPSDISRDASVILVNAIYFAGTWKERFGDPYVDDFYSPYGVHEIPMMTTHGEFYYRKSDTLNAQVIEIPYSGEESAMVIVLPYSKYGLPVLLRQLKLAPELLNNVLKRTRLEEVLLSIPKFKIETELNLNSIYKKLGLWRIFDEDKSDLSEIIDDETVYVSRSIHKAIIEVNERGTVAAASTVVVAPISGIFNIPRIEANRPFLFYIVVRSEQLFAGTFTGT